MDFSPLLDVLNIPLILAALTAIAALRILPFLVRWGYNQVIVWFKPDELGKIIKSGDRQAYQAYKQKFALAQTVGRAMKKAEREWDAMAAQEEARYQRYAQKRAANAAKRAAWRERYKQDQIRKNPFLGLKKVRVGR